MLVSGAGAVGLFATLALRELTQAGRITVVAKHAKQRELARAFGASDVVAPDEVFRGVRRATGAFRLKPEIGQASSCSAAWTSPSTRSAARTRSTPCCG